MEKESAKTNPVLDQEFGLRIREFMLGLGQNQEDSAQVLLAQHRLLKMVLEHISAIEPLHFSTLYSLMAYLGHKYNILGNKMKSMHLFRRILERIDENPSLEQTEIDLGIGYGYHALDTLLSDVFHLPANERMVALLNSYPLPTESEIEKRRFEGAISFYITEIDLDHFIVHGYREDQPGETLQAQFNVSERNEDYNPLIKSIHQFGRFPEKVNLIDCEIDEAGTLFPKGIVLKPDHLMDVTAIAECFTPAGEYPVLHLLKRFLPSKTTLSLLIGQIANFFLDQLIHHPQITFDQAFGEVFKLFPVDLAGFDDEAVKDLHRQSRIHFDTLAKVVSHDFEQEAIQPDDCFLEPTFYSPLYGIQGRLDVLCLPSETPRKAIIVELKSGSTFRENIYGINANHYIQTLLYDVMTRDLTKGNPSKSYILYSKMADRPLRFAPVVRTRQMDAIRVRNYLVLMEAYLTRMDASDPDSRALLDQLNTTKYKGLYGYQKRDVELFSKVWEDLSPLEKSYFIAFTAFSIREFHLAKTGRAGSRHAEGQSALWLANRAEKADRFAILSYLKLEEDGSHHNDPELRLVFTDRTPKLSNFRVGDITVLYPHTGKSGFPEDQVWKSSVVAIDHQGVTLRLRSPQRNKTHFEKYPFWHLESDFLDSSFLPWTKGIFAWAQAPAVKRRLLMGLEPPGQAPLPSYLLSDHLTEEQKQIIQQLFGSRDYYLIWGPPGTGKTSVVLREIVKVVMEQTGESLLLLASTNRAVDEICDAIESLGEDYHQQYLRIGSRYSTPNKYQSRLLSLQAQACTNREGVRNLIHNTRIFTGTLASFFGQSEILSQRKFDRLIIDEASQILEPALCGLLAQFDHFTLIGDHKQLPAVVATPTDGCAITASDLNEVGFENTGYSLFERLYKQTIQNGYDHAHGMLSAQGRMHKDIMAFPNQHFYDGQLKTITPAQEQDLDEKAIPHPFDEVLHNRRVGFWPVKADEAELLTKTSLAEAKVLLELFQYYQALYAAHDREWHQDTLGIITPFRAQIALIKQIFNQAGISESDYAVDTVERYQGGARDIVLISFCIHHPKELEMITSLEGDLDRKLNVALTRARQRLICIGSPKAFEGNRLYEAFIECYTLPI